MKRISIVASIVMICLLAISSSWAQVPGIINYQGRVAVGGTNFSGTGFFKFALVNNGASQTYWSNGVNTVSVPVTKGLYSVLLGDTGIANMSTVIPVAVFTNGDIRLRVWFNDGMNGFQQLSPDQRLGAVGYAMAAASLSTTGDVSGQRLDIGSGHTLVGAFSTIAGGSNNAVTANSASVGGGDRNVASAQEACVSGGGHNTGSGIAAVVAGGYGNTASGGYATIAGGNINFATNSFATVGGGNFNFAGGFAATVGGGAFNHAQGEVSTVAGGRMNWATGIGAFVGGGGYDGTVLAGNYASGRASGIVSGIFNTNTADYAFVGAGQGNTASGTNAAVGGGFGNIANNDEATVAGGYKNTAGGLDAAIPGGSGNSASGDFSFAAGLSAHADHRGAFVWADARAFSFGVVPEFHSMGDESFNVRCTGGAQFVTSTDVSGDLLSGVTLANGGNSWGSISDRNVKENFDPVNVRELLDQLSRIPVTKWNLKSQAPSIRHIGPMAQDFKAAFGVGEDDKHITSSDAAGVAFAAIQGLFEELKDEGRRRSVETESLHGALKEKDARIAALEKRLEQMEKRLEKVSERVEQSQAAPQHAANVHDAGGM